MLEALRAKRGHRKGFTIIEVMIVLAIAGLIMLIVLIAIPQLQRNQRNSARRDIVGRVKTEIDTYAGNNNGKIPTSAADLSGFATRYLTGVNIKDPKTGTDLTPTLVTSTAVDTVQGTLRYKTAQTCDGESIVGGSARQYAMWTTLEGGAIFCLDNK